MNYAIGIDVGITSVGYAVVALDAKDMPFRIERVGVRIFDAAEQPRNGESLAKPRREARNMRRRIRRRRHRKERIKGLICSSGLLSKEELDHLYDGELSDVYGLRVKALDELLSRAEFARVLLHLAQRRGFKSNRKNINDEEDKKAGVLLSVINDNIELAKKYRTVGEMFFKDDKFTEYKRNKGEKNLCTVSRDAVEAEAKELFAAQRKCGAAFATVDFEEKYLNILLSQRSFAEGPGSGPYSGNQVEKMRGECTFIKGEPRAAKASYSFQVFGLWQKINHIRLRRPDGVRPLTDDERQKVFELAHRKTDVTYADIRKALNLAGEEFFVGLNYGKKTIEETEKKEKLREMVAYHKIRTVLNGIRKDYIQCLSEEQLDAIGEALSKNHSDTEIQQELEKAQIPEEAIEKLLTLPNFPKFGHLSVAACRKILPALQRGLTYDKACADAGLNGDDKTTGFILPPLRREEESITSPVVKRAISQTIKVINAIIREQNASPTYINVELAREMALNRKDRDQIENMQKKNAERNDRAMKELKEQVREYGLAQMPTGHDLVKYKLWEQQDGICLYSGERIEIGRLMEPGYVDVDHIVPYSKTFDDRMVNKVLVKSKENREKGNRLPLEYLTGEKRDRFITLVNTMQSLPFAKKNRLLMEKIGDEKEWKERNLVDTQFTSSFLAKHIDRNLLFAPFATDKKRHVFCVNGAVTAYMRKRWKLSKVRADGDLHHAMDAAVIVCVTQEMIRKITNYNKYHECLYAEDCLAVDEETGEVLSPAPSFPEPWQGFSDELGIRLHDDSRQIARMLMDTHPYNYDDVDLDTIKPAFVSRMCNHKVTGAAHKETAQSARLYDQGQTISKVPLAKLKLDENGEIKGYYSPESDVLLYNALKKRLQEYGGKAKKAFAEDFHKPKADGSEGPIVKKVKIVENCSAGVKIHGGQAVANNDFRVRCDVFFVPGDGYYFVPIYVADTVKPQLPVLAPTQKKDKEGKKIWVPMREEDFVFSLRKNDLIRVFTKKPIKLSRISDDTASTLPESMTAGGPDGMFLYYQELDINRITISAITHDNTYYNRNLGKTLPCIEKYEVDVLGNIRKVEKENREKFHR